MFDMKKARNDAGKTQQQLADECHVARQTVTAIERGQMTPSPSVAKRLGAALGVEWTVFYDE